MSLTFGWDILAVALLSLAVYAFAIRSRLPAERALEYVGDLTAEADPDADDAETPARVARAAELPVRRSRGGGTPPRCPRPWKRTARLAGRPVRRSDCRIFVTGTG